MEKPVTERNPDLVLANGSYPSVTRVLDLVPKPFLIPWAAKIQREGAVLLDGTTTHSYRDVQEQSRAIGSMVHSMIAECLLQEDPVQYPEGPMHSAAVRAYNIWIDQCNVQDEDIVAVEVPLESHTLGLNGRPDLVVKTPGGLEILDWKTSPSLYPETRMEMAAYALLVSEHYQLPVVKLTAMRLDYTPGGTFDPDKDVMTIEDYDEDAALFQILLKAFRPLQAWQAKHHS